MKLLHLDSSILGDNSVSRTLSSAVVERLRSAAPQIDVTYRDLVADPIGHLTGRYLAGQNSDVQHDQALQEDLALGGRVLEEFLVADTVVIGVALYNFTVASQLKAWIDRILVAGKTFRYGPNGAEGLAGGKRVVLAVSRGGFYGEGTPHQSFEHAETYMRTVLGFIGITDPEVIVAEGIAIGPDQRQASIAKALTEIAELKVA
ncbi:FMN-dependent NADH-azoreductase [Aureimonas phyllosphaerae]|uniref:FMN dependent NADH:quinone oxidoreductase n=1 Tax=Aureimonas phyllosphaerae TaxID=1166078 RepID=A0A7W6FW19_9HYPH|nr:FMN-dependent NADH-azoreductase [Aureimonas phyllosphaerae]MBB3937743.1 FMN-dependent NADH-azoreductase [Aureimonas phyllosphaerae]MBB3961722.1 FMN-dependent NADH-azoreductase [Aureimonas phyllosphaerae]SFF45602.1 FMN-dependent NADH-azoreductase [Aureimonas phyllosphaerae]